MCEEQIIDISGQGDYTAKNFDTKTTYISVLGSSDVKIKTEELYGKLSGSSTITCVKKPKNIDVKRYGS